RRLVAFAAQCRQRSASSADESLAERPVRLGRSDAVLLADATRANRKGTHQTTSAKLRSTRRKYRRLANSPTITTSDDVTTVAAGGGGAPSSAQRNPSTTLTIGLKAYRARHRSGTRLLE